MTVSIYHAGKPTHCVNHILEFGSWTFDAKEFIYYKWLKQTKKKINNKYLKNLNSRCVVSTFKSTEKINRKGDDKDTNQYSNICLPHEFCTHFKFKGLFELLLQLVMW